MEFVSLLLVYFPGALLVPKAEEKRAGVLASLCKGPGTLARIMLNTKLGFSVACLWKNLLGFQKGGSTLPELKLPLPIPPP